MSTPHMNPSEVIAAALERSADAGRAWYDAQRSVANSLEVFRLRQRLDTAAAEAIELQNQARKAFATSRGWIYNPGGWWADPPVIDHSEFYDGPYRRGVAMVSHTYADRESVLQFTAAHCLKAEILPWSWWNPRLCTAVLLTTVPFGSEWPWQRRRVPEWKFARVGASETPWAYCVLNESGRGG